MRVFLQHCYSIMKSREMQGIFVQKSWAPTATLLFRLWERAHSLAGFTPLATLLSKWTYFVPPNTDKQGHPYTRGALLYIFLVQ